MVGTLIENGQVYMTKILPFTTDGANPTSKEIFEWAISDIITLPLDQRPIIIADAKYISGACRVL